MKAFIPFITYLFKVSIFSYLVFSTSSFATTFAPQECNSGGGYSYLNSFVRVEDYASVAFTTTKDIVLDDITVSGLAAFDYTGANAASFKFELVHKAPGLDGAYEPLGAVIDDLGTIQSQDPAQIYTLHSDQVIPGGSIFFLKITPQVPIYESSMYIFMIEGCYCTTPRCGTENDDLKLGDEDHGNGTSKNSIIYREGGDTSLGIFTDSYYKGITFNYSEAQPGKDYSDAPISTTNYGSADHTITSGVQLGTTVTTEEVAYDTATADGDQDDGITLPATFLQGNSHTITATVAGANGYLQGWIDWNGDGDFADSGEQIITNKEDLSATGQITTTLQVPTDSIKGITYARFRWSTTYDLNTTDPASDGEVEDYLITIEGDNDRDGIDDKNDIDDDNDGILDIVECPAVSICIEDQDLDGIPNHYDLDVDNDGIPDNIEAQRSTSYIPPSGIDSDGNGLDDAYEVTPGSGEGLTPVDTDSDNTPDYTDLDSDNDAIFDIKESGSALPDSNEDGMTDNAVGLNGLDNTIDTSDDYADPGAKIDNPLTAPYTLLDTDNNALENDPMVKDLDFRQVGCIDCDIAMGCAITSGEVSEVNIAVGQKIKTGDLLIVPSTQLDPDAGHVKAFKLNEDGEKSTVAEWDAALKMTVTQRRSKLLSTENNQLVPINNLSNTSLAVATIAEASTIKEYTLDPSYNGGTYLAGRQSGSLLGAISRGHSLSIISNNAQTALILKDPSYGSFAQSYISQRKQQVLFTSDDGFLYSTNYDTGELLWGWTPASIAKEFKNYTSFTNKHWMRGSVSVVDAKDSAGKFGTYIVGSYQSGLGHYVLKYNDSDTTTMQLESVISDLDLSGSYTAGVDNGTKVFFTDQQGLLYMAFTMMKADNSTTLFIQSVTDNSVDYRIDLNAKVTSKLLVTKDYHSRYAPSAHSLYIGLENGNVIFASLLSTSGDLNPKTTIEQALTQTAIATMESTNSSGIEYLGIVKLGKSYYLRTQTDHRLTIHRYDASQNKWLPLWTSFAGGAGSWDAQQQYTAASNPLATLQNDHPIIPINGGVQGLPVDAVITGEAYLVAGNIVLPITLDNNPTCHAYYYLFSLSDGSFPTSSFKTTTGNTIDTHIDLGNGSASSLELAEIPAKGDLIGYGNVDQNNDGSVGVPETFVIHDSVITGVRSWRIIE